MLIGVPKEVKTHEYRVGLVPGSVRELVHHGHRVIVESGAGAGIGFDDAAYRRAGAEIMTGAAEVFAAAEMIVKVKEPQPDEVALLREDQVLFTYLHLAADRELTQELLRSGAVAIAYETVTDERGGLPLLAPMSEVAGRMSVQVGAHCLEKEQGGMGILLGGVPGVRAAKVVILGGGVSGTNAARMAMGMEAHVTVIDRSLPRLYQLDMQFGSQLHTLFSTVDAIEREVVSADLVIGAVLVPGAAAPKLVQREMVRRDAAGFGHRRHLDRPGRLHRDQPPDDACRPDLCRRGRGALLRYEHAGRGRAHLGRGAEQCDAALCAGDRRARLAARAGRGPASARRAQCLPRQADPSGGRARSRAALTAAERILAE